MSVTASLLLGAALGAANAAVAMALVRRGQALGGDALLLLVLGGMVVRMAATLALFAVALALLPLAAPAFVTGFGLTLVVGLSLEVRLLSRPQAAA